MPTRKTKTLRTKSPRRTPAPKDPGAILDEGTKVDAAVFRAVRRAVGGPTQPKRRASTRKATSRRR